MVVVAGRSRLRDVRRLVARWWSHVGVGSLGDCCLVAFAGCALTLPRCLRSSSSLVGSASFIAVCVVACWMASPCTVRTRPPWRGGTQTSSPPHEAARCSPPCGHGTSRASDQPFMCPIAQGKDWRRGLDLGGRRMLSLVTSPHSAGLPTANMGTTHRERREALPMYSS